MSSAGTHADERVPPRADAPPRPVGAALPSSTLTSSSSTRPPHSRAMSTASPMLCRCDSSADSKPTIKSACVPSSPGGSAQPRPDRGCGKFAGHSFACTIWRTASQAGCPRVERRPRRWPGTRPPLDAHPRLGDDAEDALAADHHPVRCRPGTAAGQPPGLPPSPRREHAHRLDEVVDVGVVRGVVAAGAGGDPAAERREAERLREVAQREAVRPQLILELRAEDSRLDAGGPRRLVDLEHPVEAVDRDGHDRVGFRAGSRPRRPTTRRRTARPHGRCLRTSRRWPSSSASDGGWATTSGGFGNSRLKARVRSVKWAPCAWNARSHVSVVHHGASASGTLMRGGRSTASSRSGIGLATISVPARSESFVGELVSLLAGRFLALEAPGPEGTTR